MSEQPHRADRTLDVTGRACPVPITELQEFVRDLEAGTVVEVLADDGGIQWDLPAWCISHGHTLLALEETGRLWKGYVRLEE
ncbi:MAG: sulfurtransferase TusA family protein [bacterium]